MTACTNNFQGLRFLVGAASFQNAAAVTPSDTVDLTDIASALYIGGSGDVKVNMEGTGEAIVFKAVPIGLLRGRFTRVYSTDTTATSILRLW